MLYGEGAVGGGGVGGDGERGVEEGEGGDRKGELLEGKLHCVVGCCGLLLSLSLLFLLLWGGHSKLVQRKRTRADSERSDSGCVWVIGIEEEDEEYP